MDQAVPTEPAAAPRAASELRLGLVGCGYQGSALATAATTAAGVRLVACADPSRQAATRVAALAGV
jgi:predicted dehydrogenase